MKPKRRDYIRKNVGHLANPVLEKDQTEANYFEKLQQQQQKMFHGTSREISAFSSMYLQDREKWVKMTKKKV